MAVFRAAVVALALAGLPTAVPAQVFGCTNHDSNTLENDPVVKQAIEDAFKDSHEGQPDQHEEGGDIYDCLDADGPHLVIVRWKPGKYASINVGEPLDDPDCQLVGDFHTHAGAPFDYPNNDGYANEQPSNSDMKSNEEKGVPGFIKWGLDGIPESQGIKSYGPLEPTTPCRGEAEYDAAWSAGDPHLHTLDGYFYDFQGAGEFVLVQTRDDDLVVQTRQEPVGDRVTVNTAVAARIDGAVVEVNERNVVVNSRASPLNNFTSYETPDGGRVRAVDGTIRFEWKDGSRMSVIGTTVAVRLDESRRDNVEGLLGNFDGDRGNDLVDADSTDLRADNRLTFEETYGPFADAWRITDKTSLFTYTSGTSTKTYTRRDIPTAGYTTGQLDPDKRAAAETMCRAAGVKGGMRLANCVFDVAVTGDRRFADDAGGLEAEVQRFGAIPAESPLVAAVSTLRFDDATTLLDQGADPDSKSMRGQPLLHQATLLASVEMVRLLLDHGADPDLTDDSDSTALHIAAFWGFDDIAQLLLDKGADRRLRDDRGRTAADVASERHNDELAEILQ
jgi:hypothetical protein